MKGFNESVSKLCRRVVCNIRPQTNRDDGLKRHPAWPYITIMSENTSPSNKEEHFIGEHNQAPDYAKDNEFIQKGYRINFNTPKKIFRSLFMVHNESVNIWTHLLGALVVLGVLGYFLWAYAPNLSNVHDFKKELKTKFDSYLAQLNLASLTNTSNIKMDEAAEALIDKYQELSNLTTQKIQSTNNTFTKLGLEIENILQESLIAFIQAKERFEKQGAGDVIDALDQIGGNQSYFQELKSQAKELRDRFIDRVDSPEMDFIDFTESPNPGNISRWPVVIMMISAIICLLCSSIFHLFYPMSNKFYMLFARFDYAGINVLISGSTVPALYYGLYCQPALAKFYIICTFTLAISLFTASLFEFMHTEKFRTFKNICYGSFGIIVSAPMFHMLINEIWFGNGDKFTFLSSLPLFLAMGASYLGGLVIYTKRCPERHKPGNYDICGHSHQIWHLTVILGIFFTYVAALMCFEERKKYPICPVS